MRTSTKSFVLYVALSLAGIAGLSCNPLAPETVPITPAAKAAAEKDSGKFWADLTKEERIAEVEKLYHVDVKDVTDKDIILEAPGWEFITKSVPSIAGSITGGTPTEMAAKGVYGLLQVGLMIYLNRKALKEGK